jgi:hypothetical protein
MDSFHSMDEIGFGGTDLETKNALFALFIGGVSTGGSTFLPLYSWRQQTILCQDRLGTSNKKGKHFFN